MSHSNLAITPGRRFREALKQHAPLQIVGAGNMQMAKIAAHVGHQALYLSAACYERFSQTLPEFGDRNENEIYEDCKRLSAATELPLIVDIRFNPNSESVLGGRVYQLCLAGAAGVVIGDDTGLENDICPLTTLEKRIRSTVYARRDDDFLIIARTSCYPSMGLSAAVERMQACIVAGADAIYVEGINKLEDYRLLSKQLAAPLLAGIDEEEGASLFNSQDLAKVGCAMVLYPNSALRAMHKAALVVYQAILSKGDPKDVLHLMHTPKKS